MKITGLMYRLHKWAGLLSLTMLLFLTLSGLLLLFRHDINGWNNAAIAGENVQPCSYHELWGHLSDGLAAYQRKFPGQDILSVAASPSTGRLNITGTGYARIDQSGNKKAAQNAVNNNSYSYFPATGALLPRRGGEKRSPALAALMTVSRVGHTGRWLEPVGLIILRLSCVLGVVAVISGFCINGSFRHVTAKKGRGYWSRLHRLSGVVGGIVLAGYCITGLLVTGTGDIMRDYRRTAVAQGTKFMLGNAAADEIAIMPSEALHQVRNICPDDEVLRLELPLPERPFFLFYVGGSMSHPYFTADEMIFLSPAGQSAHHVVPPTELKILGWLNGLHFFGSGSLFGKLIAGIMLTATAVMLVSGVAIHACRHRERAKNSRSAAKNTR